MTKYPISVDGKQTPMYTLWHNVKRRCKPGGFAQSTFPSYLGCTIHPDFNTFDGFMDWATQQVGFGFNGAHLDKDILVPGNKVYGPDTCCFVPSIINTTLTYKRRDQKYPPGVSIRDSGKYLAQIRTNGKVRSLGLYDTQDAAFDVYKRAKESEIHSLAEQYKDVLDPRVYSILSKYEIIL